MKRWQKRYPPYEGTEPYVFFVFAEADSARAWRILRVLLARGCRVWYVRGRAGSAEELIRRQERAAGAGLTILYLTDAARADKDVKSYVLVNQKRGRPILCLDPDGTDRRLSMGLRESAPHLPLYRLRRREDLENALIHADGFAQEMLGEPLRIRGGDGLRTLSLLLCAAAALTLLVSLLGFRYLQWFRPPAEDEVLFTDPVILSAVREAARGGPITAELAGEISFLRLDGLPESWDDLSLLPALEGIELPQQAITPDAELPEGCRIELSGGGA